MTGVHVLFVVVTKSTAWQAFRLLSAAFLSAGKWFLEVPAVIQQFTVSEDTPDQHREEERHL